MLQLRWVAMGLAILASLFAGWMLLGLRYVNHDDLYFDLIAHNPDISLGEATLWVMRFGRRFSHLLNVPSAVLTLRIVDIPIVGDLAILGQLAVIVGGTAFIIARFVGGVAACGWIMTLTGGLALHWYFTPPIGYPLHGLNSVMLLVISLLALIRYAEGGGRRWLFVSAFCSTIGVIWPEFNYIIFSVATLTAVIFLRDDWRARLYLLMPFLVLWAGTVVAQFAIRPFLEPIEDGARMTLSLDIIAWAAALRILLVKAILPIAMVGGVSFPLAPIPGMPPIPSQLNYAILWHVMASAPVSFCTVLSVWTMGFFVILRGIAPRWAGLWLLLAAGAVMLFVPLGVVSLSTGYQNIVQLGYTQGTIATVHAQVGFLTFVFSAVAMLALRWSSRFGTFCLSALLGVICTISLSYNLLNRDGMAANQQRWSAFSLLAQALPDGTKLYAPFLWETNGVSNIPGGLTFGMTNYWTERARIWHSKRITVLPPEAAFEKGSVRANIGLRSDGRPLVILRDEGSVVLLASRPTLIDYALTGNNVWNCNEICRLRLLVEINDVAESQILDSPSGLLPRDLLSWIAVPRNGGTGWR